MADTHWYLRGACLDNPEFEAFPGMKETRVIAKSKAICRNCPVKRECWADAYSSHTDEGIFGGALPSERRMAGAVLNIPQTAPFDVIVKLLTR